jgi:hypothetical protein
MIRLVTRGRLTQNYAKGLLAKPEDREPVIRKLIENLSQNRLKRITRQASWTKPRKLWAWYSQRMRIRRCH